MVGTLSGSPSRAALRRIGALLRPRPFGWGEEIANAVTHGVACVACIAVTPSLVTTAVGSGDALAVVGLSIFAGTTILLYLTSCIYHGVAHTSAGELFERFDHIAIYLLIAGSYTPFCLAVLPPVTGLVMLSVIWSLALGGILIKAIAGTKRWRLPSLGLYLLMGWAVVPVMGPLVRALPAAGTGWLVAGGLAYTLGSFFFLAEQIRFGHMIWHLLVVLGTACHVVAMFYVP
jgi:hemolysin III